MILYRIKHLVLYFLILWVPVLLVGIDKAFEVSG